MKTFIYAAALSATALAASAEMTDAERQAFREEVRAYLLENPDVILEAMQVLEDRNTAEQAVAEAEMLEANELDLYFDEASWAGGNLEGDVTVVEFLDYRCGYCRRAHPEVAELIESDGNIRLIVKEFPILGEDSLAASRFAIATLQKVGPEAYKAAHDALIELPGQVTDEALRQVAGTIGVEADLVMAHMESPDVDSVIAENRALAQRLQINGTPSFVLAGQMVRGYVPLDGMRQIVANARED